MAHPTKISKTDKKIYDVPTLYSISGSANFFNKTHNGLTIYRGPDSVDVHIQKVKQSWLGKVGLCSFTYNTFTRQYTPTDDFEPEERSLIFLEKEETF
jgi:twinkle protein